MKKSLALGLIVSSLYVTNASAEIKVYRPWVRATTGPNAAVYMKIVNDSKQEKKLTNIETKVSDRIELHTNQTNDNGTKTMQKLGFIEIPPDGNRDLEPGNQHIMLMKINRALPEGDNIHLTLDFDDGERVNVIAPVRTKAYE